MQVGEQSDFEWALSARRGPFWPGVEATWHAAIAISGGLSPFACAQRPMVTSPKKRAHHAVLLLTNALPTAPTSVPTNSWWRRLREESSAFEAIMRRHNWCCSAQRAVVSDDAEAQDVVQETYLRASPGCGILGCYRWRTWMARIAINVADWMLRKRSRSVPLDSHDLHHEPLRST